ncbi:MAG: ammonia-forming cytochrome c nitrite reductase subunit c552 [Alphaproteobacteria bacterium]|jgi:hypothetical protein|nr:ammonia-forming cytochrome c nitrite reductase subunit c552 [Alphaproteobacteria bacterium]
MAKTGSAGHFVFPRWANLALPALLLLAAGGPAYLGTLVPYTLAPTTVNVGYRPEQPVAYSHEVHVGQLGIDCRYCHTSVEDAGFAAIPPTSTCMNCHHAIQKNSEKVLPIRESYEQGTPILWAKVHDLPDYAYFNHAVHVNAGVSCVECHGRVDRMGEAGVHTVESLSMAWCIECHRNPTDKLRPTDEVTHLGWDPLSMTRAQRRELERLHERVDDNQSLQNCSTCHR